MYAHSKIVHGIFEVILIFKCHSDINTLFNAVTIVAHISDTSNPMGVGDYNNYIHVLRL